MAESDLQALLAGYRRGETALAALAAAFRRRLAESPQAAATLAGVLEAARGDTLDEPAYVELRSIVGEAPAGPGDDDRTRVIEGGTAGRGRPAAQPGPQSADDAADRTRVLAGGTGGAGSEDAASGVSASTLAGTQGGDATDRTRVLAGGTGGVASEGAASGASSSTLAGTQGGDATDRTRVLAGGTGGRGEESEASTTAGSGDAGPATRRRDVGAGPSETTATPPEPSPPASRDLVPGDVLKDRFRLVEPLGSGGMGTVWKAVDKLKEEARDRNPFVAVKLLSGDFRDHPEAFIALQRESAKQQRLAHPNIATVFDFDRDGDNVYMTMEVMTGTPLDEFIASVPEGGLDYESALPVIEELGAGLAYAHQAGLVHSDLKPGNAFVTDDGHVKLLDFGIARASKTRASAEGETTLFDPGQLGALTPSYATIEMFEGSDPDPRDDIYALAIIAYQLFTGRHPFDRKPAPRAKEMGLAVEPVAKLTRRQNQALLAGLAFDRGARIESVEAFLDGLRPYRNILPWVVGGALVVCAIIGVLAYKPVVEYLEERQRESIIEVFEAGGQENVSAAMALVEALDRPAQRAAIVADARARQAIINVHVARGRRHFEPEAQRYDFAAAMQVMAELRALYPDSAEVLELRTELTRVRDETLGRLAERYGALMAAGRLTPDPEGDDVLDVRGIVARIDPEHPLLADPALARRYEVVARAESDEGRNAAALATLETGLSLVGEDAGLLALRTEVEASLVLEAQARRVAELEAALAGASLATLSEFDAVRAGLVELQSLRPGHALLEPAQGRLRPVFADAFAGLMGAGDAARASRRLQSYARLLSTPAVLEYRGRVEGMAVSPAPAEEVESAAAGLEALVSSPAPLDADWERRVGMAYRALLALAGESSPDATSARERVTDAYLSRAVAAREAERFDEALALVARGGALMASEGAFEAERASVEAARESKRRREEEARRLARIEALRETVAGHASAGRVEAAREALGELREVAGARDGFVIGDGPALIAGAYLERGRAASGRGEHEVALREVEAGLEVRSGDADLTAASAAYRAAVESRALALQRRRTVAGAPGAPGAAAPDRIGGSALAVSPTGAGARVAPVERRAAGYPALGEGMAKRIAGRIAIRARGEADGGRNARALAVLEAGLSLVGEDAGLLALRAEVEASLVLEATARRVAELEAALAGASLATLSEFDAVRAGLVELQSLRPGHALLEPARGRLGPVFADAFARLAEAGDAARWLRSYSSLLSTSEVRDYRERLEARGVSPAPAAEVESAAAGLAALVSSPAPLDADWELRVGVAYRALLALAGESSSSATSARERVTDAYLSRAVVAREAERFDEALALVARGGALMASGGAFEAERASVEAARESKRRREEEARRLARIEALRETVAGHASAGRVEAAREALGELREVAGARDGFVTGEGPALIAGAYLERGRAASGRGEHEVALREVEAGLEVRSGDADLTAASAAYRAAVESRALALQRRRTVPGAPGAAPPERVGVPALALSPGSGPAGAAPVERRAAGYPALGEGMAKRIAERVASGARGGADRVRALGRPLDGYRALFPDDRAALERRIEATIGGRLRAMAAAKDVAAHNSLLRAARGIGLLGSRSFLEPPKPSALIAGRGSREIEAGRLDAAERVARLVMTEQPDATNLDAFRDAIERRRSRANAAFSKYRRYAEVRSLRTARRYLDEAIAQWSDNAEFMALRDRLSEASEVKRGSCTASLAGHGKQRRGRCHDDVADGRGPTMVVVPGAAGQPPFAIGRTEVTVDDLNHYCRTTRACAALPGAKTLPATGVAVATVRDYAKWLSRESGATYRLPTEAEWEHAARADGAPLSKDANCRVARGGEVIKGHSLRRATTGRANTWGLVNFVGNAREWVTTGAGALAVRGGAYSTSLVECSVELRAVDRGAADEATGFRLVRELD